MLCAGREEIPASSAGMTGEPMYRNGNYAVIVGLDPTICCKKGFPDQVGE